MKVTIAIDDISLPLPPMRTPDVRERVLEIVLRAARRSRRRRRRTSSSPRAPPPHDRARRCATMVGDKIFNAYCPDRSTTTTPRTPTAWSCSARPRTAEVVELNRRAVESDLVIYVNLNLVPMDGGHKSVAVGLCGYESLQGAPQPARRCASATRTWTRSAPRSHRSVERMGQLVDEHAQRLPHRDDDQQPHVRRAARVPHEERGRLHRARSPASSQAHARDALKAAAAARQAKLFQAVPAPYGVTGVLRRRDRGRAREDAREAATSSTSCRSRARPTSSSTGIPYISPYNVNSFLNPLLVQVMALRLLLQPLPGQAAGEEGRHDDRHAPVLRTSSTRSTTPRYIEFFHRLLPGDARRAWSSHKRYEAKFADEPGVHRRCTAPGTRTTARTRSSCGTGARPAASTSAA